MSLTEIDHWIGKTLFVPPIIKLCQLTRQSQFAVSRLFWFAAALDGLYHAQTFVMAAIWGGVSVFMMITAARRADAPTASLMFLRLLAMALFVVDLLRGIATGDWAGIEFWLLVLIAEYAATIRTLPPRNSAKRSSSRQPSSRSV